MTDTLTHLRLYAPAAESRPAAPRFECPAPRGLDPFTRRLESVLESAARALNMSAAGLYLLDEDTTVLDLRAGWHLSAERFAQPPRALAGATADLEAMCGHAVTLEDAKHYEHWNLPEAASAALCVPVSGESNVHGTLWLFDERARSFLDREVLVAEIAAGRLAAELDRAAAARAPQTALRDSLADARQWQRRWLPNVAPHSGRWDIAGWTAGAPGLSATFHDWRVGPHDCITMIAAQAGEQGLIGALSAASLRSAWRAIAESCADPADLLGQLNAALWNMSPGDQLAHAAVAVLGGDDRWAMVATAGDADYLRVGANNMQCGELELPPLGQSGDSAYVTRSIELTPDDALLLVDGRWRRKMDESGRILGMSGLAEQLSQTRREPAEIVKRLREAFGGASSDGGSAIVVHPRG